jgi:hypothetical protein
MKKDRQSLYDLTPLGDDWGAGYRFLEIVGQTIGLIVVKPVLSLVNWFILRKINK